MTFWTKLQHELLCFVCAEDEIFDGIGIHENEYSLEQILNILKCPHGTQHLMVLAQMTIHLKTFRKKYDF